MGYAYPINHNFFINFFFNILILQNNFFYYKLNLWLKKMAITNLISKLEAGKPMTRLDIMFIKYVYQRTPYPIENGIS